MNVACKLLLGLALLQGAAYAADEPKIDVIDGKISISAQAVPLARFLKLFDRALGLNSEVKPGQGLENRNVSVQFTDLNFDEAVRKIFQGMPLNYVVIKGKGIKVDLAQGGPVDSPAFSSPLPPSLPQIQPIQQPILNQQNPIQAVSPSPFGSPAPNPAVGAANPSAPLTGPGVLPPPIGANNSPNNPFGGPPTGGNVFPPGGGGGAQAPTQPAALLMPGALPGAAPGTIK